LVLTCNDEYTKKIKDSGLWGACERIKLGALGMERVDIVKRLRKICEKESIIVDEKGLDRIGDLNVDVNSHKVGNVCSGDMRKAIGLLEQSCRILEVNGVPTSAFNGKHKGGKMILKEVEDVRVYYVYCSKFTDLQHDGNL
jgi:DNA polymerase III delta prime subunit